MPTSETQAAADLAAVLDAHVGFGDLWRRAFAEVHRGDFLPDVALFSDREGLRTVSRVDDPQTWLAAAYRPDVSVRIMDGDRVIRSAASQPLAMAELLLAAKAQPGMRVLEIGSGVGFLAAILAHTLGAENITTIELDPVMAATAQANLADRGVVPLLGDGMVLDRVDGPFDRIISTCAVDHIPKAWLDLCPGGRIIAPWITTYDASATAVLAALDGTAVGRFLPGVAFMPAAGMPREDDEMPTGPERRDVRRSTTWLRCPQVTATRKAGAALAIGLQLPGVRYSVTGKTPSGDFGVTICDAAGSWARTSCPPTMDVVQFDVEQAGPRNLWDEVETAYRRWRSWSRPGPDRFGLTVDADTVEYWLDHPNQPISSL